MDFTDPENPFEIAYFDRGPVESKMLVLGGEWSAYWYNGYIYGSEIARGLDVFELSPSKFLTQNEIDAAKTVRVAELNVQNQQKIAWPAKLVVAKAYVDQLERSAALPAQQIAALRQAMQSAESSHLSRSKVANSLRFAWPAEARRFVVRAKPRTVPIDRHRPSPRPVLRATRSFADSAHSTPPREPSWPHRSRSASGTCSATIQTRPGRAQSPNRRCSRCTNRPTTRRRAPASSIQPAHGRSRQSRKGSPDR